MAIGVLAVAALVLGITLAVHKIKTSSDAGANISATSSRPAVTNPTVSGKARDKPTKVPVAKSLASPATLNLVSKVAGTAHLASRATFKATYRSYNVLGSPAEVIVEQRPPDTLFRAGNAEVIRVGGQGYYCTTTVPTSSCKTISSPSVGQLGHLMAVYSTESYASTLSTLNEMLRSGVVSGVSSSHKLFAGQLSDCLSWRYHKSVLGYCVTHTGILASFTIVGGIPGQRYSIKLTSYSAKPTAADFALPNGTK